MASLQTLSTSTLLTFSRPALDSVEAFVDRFLWMPVRIALQQTPYRTLPFFSSSLQLFQAAPTPKPASLDLAEMGKRVEESCSKNLAAVKSCMVSISWKETICDHVKMHWMVVVAMF